MIKSNYYQYFCIYSSILLLNGIPTAGTIIENDQLIIFYSISGIKV